MAKLTTTVLEAHVLTDADWLGAAEICSLCRINLEAMLELADLGLFTPRREAGAWQLPATALPRLRVAAALMRDLGVNGSGAALVVELMETQRTLERRIRDLEGLR